MKLQNWNLALKNRKSNGLYNVAVRFYRDGEEKYMDTNYRVTRTDWMAKSGPGFRKCESIRETLMTKVDTTIKAISDAEQKLTFELFKAVWNGKKISSERSWITLLDKHVELGNFKLGTQRIYESTRTILGKIEAAGHDLGLNNFQSISDYERLEGWFSKYTRIGRTTLAINMQNIKAIAETGYDPRVGLRWIPTDAFRFYEKPTRIPGTHPNTYEDFKRIQSFDVTTIGATDAHRRAYKAARDFWCWMVLCGGMEARSIANLKKTSVFKDYFEFERAKVEDRGVKVKLAITETTRYMFDTYGGDSEYVFPFLTSDMTPVQRESAIINLANRITRRVQTIARKLGIKPLPTCKRARPTFAVLSRKLGLTLPEQQQMMGHASSKTTEIYMTHIPTEEVLSSSRKFHNKLTSS